MRLIECIPNFSEGRDLTVVAAIRDAIASVEGVSVLHVTADASHNRSVITFVAPYEVAVDAAFVGIREARDRIDITAHAGVHPRIGAADVVPFVPLDGTTMGDCVALARQLGERVGRELEIPVYLYERAATRVERQNLAEVRRGGFEGLREVIEADPSRAPDFGPARVHPTSGAVAIGARPFLVAFNVYLGSAANLAVAKQVARAVRASNGGLPYVKALGLEVDGQAQVSMNLVDIERTPLSVAFDAVRREAVARGVHVTWSEIIGLVPERVLFETAAAHLRLRQPVEDHVLERRLLEAKMAGPGYAGGHAGGTLERFVEEVGRGTPTPGGGSVAAYAGALAAALVRMVASVTLGREQYAGVRGEMAAVRDEGGRIAARLVELSARDAEAYDAVVRARRLPKESEGERGTRLAVVRDALMAAAAVPAEVARLCARVAELAAVMAARGNAGAVTDAGTAALLAEAACRAAALNVRVNVSALRNGEAPELEQAAGEYVSATVGVAREVAAAVENVLATPKEQRAPWSPSGSQLPGAPRAE